MNTKQTLLPEQTAAIKQIRQIFKQCRKEMREQNQLSEIPKADMLEEMAIVRAKSMW